MAPAIGPGIGVSFGRRAAGPDLDVVALIARMAVPPDAARAKLIAALVQDLKSSGVWQTLDGLYVMAAHDAQAARLNWRGDLLNLTPAASPIFTADRGYQGDGAAAYLAIDNADANAVRFTENGASIGVWLNFCTAEQRNVLGRTDNGALQLMPLSAADTITGRMQTVSGSQQTTTVAGYTGRGMTRMTREVIWQYYLRPHGLARALRTVPAASGNPRRPHRFLAGINTSGTMLFSTARIAAGYFGGGLTNAQEVAMDATLQTYLSAVGGA
ncbi:hypothetical protein LUX29_17800 [Aureimonas altamirensis]|uniref:hypothetical protein n=1 Tax=Aureimonas altamirensis TaxID=370622 RepID=UPI001E399F97|nr:hypothetical protein [Aureimonas altamirensis]UHD44860.1 hypothetical protein LUX29_17800 [Aureimonas altamirensis]